MQDTVALKKSELYSHLWASCDELRGGMDASQYKDYVLVLLFIKYVSDKFSGAPYAPITIPPGASFKDMVALKGTSDIGDQINKRIIAPLANANQLSDFPDFNDATKLGDGKEKVERLTNLIAIFENPALDFSRNRAEGDDILGDAYDAKLLPDRRREIGSIQRAGGRGVRPNGFQISGIGSTLVLPGCRGWLRGPGKETRRRHRGARGCPGGSGMRRIIGRRDLRSSNPCRSPQRKANRRTRYPTSTSTPGTLGTSQHSLPTSNSSRTSARMRNPWSGSHNPWIRGTAPTGAVYSQFQPKKGNPDEFRPILEFGIRTAPSSISCCRFFGRGLSSTHAPVRQARDACRDCQGRRTACRRPRVGDRDRHRKLLSELRWGKGQRPFAHSEEDRRLSATVLTGLASRASPFDHHLRPTHCDRLTFIAPLALAGRRTA